MAASGRASRSMPPVTVRVGTGEVFVRKSPRRGRRRYQAALALPRASLRAPSLPAVRVTWRWFSFLLVIGTLYALYMLWASPMFYVNRVEVYGNERVSAEEIGNALALEGMSVFWVVPEDVARRVAFSFRELESVAVDVTLPNRVVVTVRERQPVIEWQQDGGYTWIDANGVAFRPHGRVEGLVKVVALSPPPSPVADKTGEAVPAPFISPQMVRTLQALAPFIPEGVPVVYEAPYGLMWADPRGWQVVFGAGDGDVARRMAVYQAVVDYLMQQGIRPTLINVAYPDAPFYRLEQ